jgi:purine-binding chemotaxis protein CheW
MANSAAGTAETNTQAPAEWGSVDLSSTGAALTQFISFAIGNEQYGVDIMSVREIKGWTDVTNLPNQPDYVRGVLNLRGVIIPIIDLRVRFGNAPTAATQSHIIIIVQVAQRLAGMLADRVLDIVSIDPGKIHPVPKISRAARAEFLSGLVTVDNELIALIDLQNLLAGAIEMAPGEVNPN